MLNTTDIPLFFLFAQLVIAVLLFLAASSMGFLKVPLYFDKAVVQGLIPMIALNVVGLRCVGFRSVVDIPLNFRLSFSNYTLKYVDASFYQVARGMVLPFTCVTSFVMLNSRPSLRILFACFLVTIGFFIGVFLDGTSVSTVGITFGVLSSMITACHSVVIKRSLDVVKGSALHLSWYTNLYSAIALLPLIMLAGEVPRISSLFSDGVEGVDGGLSPLGTFFWGSAISVSFYLILPCLLAIDRDVSGSVWVLDEHCQLVIYQSDFTDHTYGFIRSTRRCSFCVGHVAFL